MLLHVGQSHLRMTCPGSHEPVEVSCDIHVDEKQSISVWAFCLILFDSQRKTFFAQCQYIIAFAGFYIQYHVNEQKSTLCFIVNLPTLFANPVINRDGPRSVCTYGVTFTVTAHVSASDHFVMSSSTVIPECLHIQMHTILYKLLTF